MLFSIRNLPLSAISLLSFTNHTVGANTDKIPSIIPKTPAAVFQDSSSIDGQFVFAASVYQPNISSNATADLYLHMSAPSAYQWMGVGLGSSMSNALMWIAYPSENGTGMTLSVRLSHAHREPDSFDFFGCEQIWGDELPNANRVTKGDNGTMTLNAVCRGAPTWNDTDAVAPTLQNTTNNTFIYALGPHDGYGSHGGRKMRSDYEGASLNMHSYHGSFTMQIEQAVTNDSSAAGVPQPNGASGNTWMTENTSSPSGTKKDHNPLPAIHGFIMCLTFVIIFPSGALALHVLQRVLLHAVVQAIGFALVCIATVAGIVISTKYNWSRKLLSAHQIIGVLIFIALAAQMGLGILHHRIFEKQHQQQRQWPTIPVKIHKYLGPTTIVAGLINVPIGLVYAGNPLLCLPYLAVLAIIALIFIGIRWRRARRTRPQDAGTATVTGSKGPQHPRFGSYEQLHAPQAAYGKNGGYNVNEVPLGPYGSRRGEWA